MQAVRRAFSEVKRRISSYLRRFKALYLRNKRISIPLSAILLINLVLVVALIIIGKLPAPFEPIVLEANHFKLEALQKDSAGVEPSSEFLLSAENPIDEGKIKSALKILPDEKYDLIKISNTEFKIKFPTELSQDKIYKFEILGKEGGVEKSLSWAFQIKGSFRVIRTLPRNEANFVPTNSGIEIVFSHENFKFKDIGKFIEIKPKVAGKFEKHKRTLVFVHKGLKPATLYSVKIKKGIGLVGSEEILKENKTFQFETKTKQGSEANNYFTFSSKTYEFPKSEKPVLSGWGRGKPKQANVYKLDEKTFLKSLKQVDSVPSWTSLQSKKYSTKGLTKFLQFDPVIISLQNSSYIEIPKKFPNGFYLVVVENEGGGSSQTWLQITPVSVYVTISETKSLFWVNSVETKKPIQGASVELIGGGFSSKTDKDGIAQAETPNKLKNSNFHYFKIQAKNANLILRVGGFYRDPAADKFWHYLYLDRGLFRTSDSVSFWGVLRRREGGTPETVKLELKQNSYVDYFYNPITIITKEVAVSEFSTFNGSLDFSNLNPGSYTVELKVRDVVIETKSIRIGIFDKPAYQIKVTPSKKAVIVGDKVTYKVKTEFFEGTPAPNISLKVSGSIEKTIKTNTNGEISLTLKSKPQKSSPGFQNIYIRPTESEVGDISAGAGVHVFSSTINIRGEGEIKEGKAKIQGTIKKVDLSKVDKLYTDDYLGGPVSTDLNAKVYETSQIATETGEYYDFIEKKIIKTYKYKQKKELINTLEAKSDQNGKFNLEFDANSAKDYQLEISAKDEKGRQEKTTIYVSRSVRANAPYYYLENTKDFPTKYKIGEKVELQFKKGRDPLKPKPDLKFLYYQGQIGLMDYTVSLSPTYTFSFEEKHIPNVSVTGVLFNGFTYKASSTPHFWAVGGSNVDFDEEERELIIEVKAGKNKYNPGDKAKVEVMVRDKNNKGVEAEVNINIIDESLYAVSREASSLNPLSGLYRNVTNGVFASYLSHQYPIDLPGSGAGGGGGGRDDFRDKVFFGVLKTDKDGKGLIDVKLPDNLTTWRVSSQAVTIDLKIGKGVGAIVVSKDLFVEVNLPSELLLSDKPQIKLRAFGNALKSGDLVEFAIKAESLGWKKEKKVKGKAFKASFIKLPKLKEGTHKITFSVKAKDLNDALTKQVQVIKGRTRVGKIKEYSLKPELKLEGGTGQNTLTFINEIQGTSYPILKKQLWSFSDRLETKLAQEIAAKLLKKHFNEDQFVDQINFVRYQTTDGGLAIFPYADNNLELSAKIASYDANNFDKDGLRSYFLSILDNKKEGRERSLVALWGLASIGDPVLVNLQSFTSGAKLSLRERLYVALAYIELGDKEKAREMFDEILEKSAEQKPPYIYIKDKDRDKSFELTALAAMIGAKLQDKNTTAIMRYLADEKPEKVLIDIERVLAAVDYLSGFAFNEASFTINIEGEEKTIDLKGRPYFMSVTADKLEKLSFKDIKGKVLVSVSYETTLNKAGISRDKSLDIKREYSENNNVTTDISEGALVKITINYDISGPIQSGCYQVTDHLPSGLRAVTNPARFVSERDTWYLYQNTGQTISFCVRKEFTKPIKYFARVIAKGEYLAEPATIQHQKAKDRLNFTSSQIIKIR